MILINLDLFRFHMLIRQLEESEPKGCPTFLNKWVDVQGLQRCNCCETLFQSKKNSCTRTQTVRKHDHVLTFYMKTNHSSSSLTAARTCFPPEPRERSNALGSALLYYGSRPTRWSLGSSQSRLKGNIINLLKLYDEYIYCKTKRGQWIVSQLGPSMDSWRSCTVPNNCKLKLSNVT